MRVTLQSRIATIMIISVVVLISAFTFIQLQNQLRSITAFNSLRAKLTAQIVKDSARKALQEAPKGEGPEQTLGSVLDSLRNSDLLEVASIYSEEGAIVASTQDRVVGRRASRNESLKINKTIENAKKGIGVSSVVDKAARSLRLYIPIIAQDRVAYVGRLDMSLGNIGEAMRQVYIPVVFTAAAIIIANILFAVVLSKRVIGPISLLNEATKEISEGDLDLRIHMDTKDELGELADTFNVMAVELKKMKLKAENANPLTKLPGNIIIQEEVERRIKNDQKFTVIYSDLDDFKAFNDKYGIHAGDDAIKLTASILKEAVAQKGNLEDFVGHEGGDDFILLTTPDKAEGVGKYIIAQLDKRIRSLYNKEDIGRGYIMAKSRQGDQTIKYPIMTISLAGVTNKDRPISSYGEVTNIAAEVKKKAKQVSGSYLIIDRRKVPFPLPKSHEK